MGDQYQAMETEARAVSGWIALLCVCALLAFGAFFVGASIAPGAPLAMGVGIGLLAAGLFCLRGFFTLQPNQAAVMLFLGTYAGSARQSGFHWANPFYRRLRLSLRARNLTTPILKVNDGRGNPIEIGAVVVWRVQDTARAVFEVEDFCDYVRLQCESALRDVASRHAYDNADDTLLGSRVRTLRNDAERICESLRHAIQSHVEMAGIAIVDARIAHLGYAPEIAPSMLRRQQAEAVIAARRKLVEGAVGMVEMALIDINEKSLASFTPAQRVALVTNLMTVLAAEASPQTVVQMGQE
jgi:regulator of protease activity HflC (stomatin/prohibitin superfamily)